MTSPTPDHAFIRDRAPIATTTLPTLWRYRWRCTCGADGPWHTEAPEGVYRGWLGHHNAQGRVRQWRGAS